MGGFGPIDKVPTVFVAPINDFVGGVGNTPADDREAVTLVEPVLTLGFLATIGLLLLPCSPAVSQFPKQSSCGALLLLFTVELILLLEFSFRIDMISKTQLLSNMKGHNKTK